MDNILKLTVGCLGLVGLIVMVVPNSDPLAATKAETEGTAPIAGAGAPTPPPPTTASPAEQAEPSEFVVDDYDIANFGQPMVDPTPPAQRALIAQQQQQQQQAANLNNGQMIGGQGNAGQSQMGGTESTGPAGPPPPPPVSGN